MTNHLLATPGGEGGDGGGGAGGGAPLMPHVEKNAETPVILLSSSDVRSHFREIEWYVHCLHFSSEEQSAQQASALGTAELA